MFHIMHYAKIRKPHLQLKGAWTGWSESTLAKMSHCCKSHVAAHLLNMKFRMKVGLLCLDLGSTSPDRIISQYTQRRFTQKALDNKFGEEIIIIVK